MISLLSDVVITAVNFCLNFFFNIYLFREIFLFCRNALIIFTAGSFVEVEVKDLAQQHLSCGNEGGAVFSQIYPAGLRIEPTTFRSQANLTNLKAITTLLEGPDACMINSAII